MLQLATAQRMNSDTRRAIFCVLMSGEVYIVAFEKLLRLDLQEEQVPYVAAVSTAVAAATAHAHASVKMSTISLAMALPMHANEQEKDCYLKSFLIGGPHNVEFQ
ncbi:hypothetical protein Nepgr_020931 [Nepenthes gracilis]|uniref:Uncharacterized protein n=1 Tax=Nepenthes gracilis TaxID=150966 RepID=A0AAD3SXR5_NEPGR|nr:hypothetical protein Nepgr_020931 [Nepenthes gracilis]